MNKTVDPLKFITHACEEKMIHSINHLEKTLSTIRVGKASTHILESVYVEYYGSMVPLHNVATISIADTKTIIILPWEKSMFKTIEKAIQNSKIGINPENNGEIIRLNIPPLTEERRKVLAKQSRVESENTKISIRNTRREAIENIKKIVKEGIAEDKGKEIENVIHKIYTKYTQKVYEISLKKEKEIMTI